MKQVADGDGERALLAAILLQACKDTIGRGAKLEPGDSEKAREWLAVEGCFWAEALGICAYDVVESWAYHPGPVPRRSAQARGG